MNGPSQDYFRYEFMWWIQWFKVKTHYSEVHGWVHTMQIKRLGLNLQKN